MTYEIHNYKNRDFSRPTIQKIVDSINNNLIKHESYIVELENESEVRHWVINHLDLSQEWNFDRIFVNTI